MSDVARKFSNPAAGRVLRSPAALLLITGSLIGLNFPLGKLGSDAGISPVLWALIVSLGASLMLLPLLAAKRRLSLPRGKMIRYVMVSALISFVVPNLLLFSALPHVGSGYSGLMFALSPVFTLSFAVLFRLKGPSSIGVIGIGFGLAGAAIVAITKGAAPEAPPALWILAALSVPIALAAGNVYRTLDWPEGESPDALAFWSHSFAVVVFAVLLLLTDGTLPLQELLRAPWASLAQAVVAGLTFPVFFRLQQQGGPVLLSQIGYVAAAVGLIAATAVLGEQYSLATWIGAAVITAGIGITVYSQIAKN